MRTSPGSSGETLVGIIALIFISAIQFLDVLLISFGKVPGASLGVVSYVGTGDCSCSTWVRGICSWAPN